VFRMVPVRHELCLCVPYGSLTQANVVVSCGLQCWQAPFRSLSPCSMPGQCLDQDIAISFQMLYQLYVRCGSAVL
jgi:hypothetical protein